MLTLYDLYAIVVKDRVYVVDKMNVEFWGLSLTLIKNINLTDSEGYGG